MTVLADYLPAAGDHAKAPGPNGKPTNTEPDVNRYRLASCGCLVRAYDSSRIVKPCWQHKQAMQDDKES